MQNFVVREDNFSEKEKRNLSILDSIRRGKEVSRADVSKSTDLNIVTVSNYVSKYIKNKIVFETGLDISTGGRRPELLELNREYGYSIGIDLGAPHLTVDSSIVGVLMDLSGKILAKEKIKKEKESFDNLIQKVVDVCESLMKQTGIPASKLKGIGVGIWGVLDRYRGMARYAIEEEETVSYTKLLDRLEAKYYVPTVIEHDATLAAFGERWIGMGAGSVANNLIFMCSDSSCGLIIKGEIYYGSTKSAGELNINPPDENVGSSDGKACWETYDHGCCMRSRGIDLGISERVKSHFKENAKEVSPILTLAGGDLQKINLNTVIEAAQDGDKYAQEVMREAGSYLGAKIAYLVNLFNPEVVIIGRGIEKAGDMFLDAVRQSVKRWAYDESAKVAKILPTSLEEDVVAAGAAGIVVQNVFAKV